MVSSIFACLDIDLFNRIIVITYCIALHCIAYKISIIRYGGVTFGHKIDVPNGILYNKDLQIRRLVTPEGIKVCNAFSVGYILNRFPLSSRARLASC